MRMGSFASLFASCNWFSQRLIYINANDISQEGTIRPVVRALGLFRAVSIHLHVYVRMPPLPTVSLLFPPPSPTAWMCFSVGSSTKNSWLKPQCDLSKWGREESPFFAAGMGGEVPGSLQRQHPGPGCVAGQGSISCSLLCSPGACSCPITGLSSSTTSSPLPSLATPWTCCASPAC